MATPTPGFLFDLDGVLIDSESRYTEIWDEINSIYPTGVDDFARKIKGTSLENILNGYFSEADRPAVTQMLLDREETMVYDYCPGAAELLLAIRDAGLKSVLVTSSNSIKLGHLWDQHPDLKGMFAGIVDADMVSRSKPDPEGYLKGAAMLGLPASQCIVFEDSLQGVKAGKAAGSMVVGVWGTLAPDVIRPYADMLVHNLSEVSLDSILEMMRNRKN